jgi:hypothetical protein
VTTPCETERSKNRFKIDLVAGKTSWRLRVGRSFGLLDRDFVHYVGLLTNYSYEYIVGVGAQSTSTSTSNRSTSSTYRIPVGGRLAVTE